MTNQEKILLAFKLAKCPLKVGSLKTITGMKMVDVYRALGDLEILGKVAMESDDWADDYVEDNIYYKLVKPPKSKKPAKKRKKRK